ncbi:YbaB/EbfC family nucleoid-associated protein [Paractinoplanes atraurantiacus]|uniref:YbaB/EbfC DNA-binding family protein n=1 Tax=Paractinoplanes atraurantiacus TaxID=1036182 RepID=A0A285HG33_9ACTN|nr:YbaB/EbfC family nucleoid-associated protein [Actinoplanes atraurantiacus]SNY34604.1 YbaB/EbfC DNA-binding family protein [Actinoplanes atraurantiacus]
MTGALGESDFLTPESSRAYLQDWKQRIDRNAANAQAMSDRLGELRTTGRDGNDLVEVTIDASGVLRDIQFTDRIHRFAPDVVGRAVMAALREAKHEATRQSQAIIVDTVGPDSLAGRVIGERLEDHG